MNFLDAMNKAYYDSVHDDDFIFRYIRRESELFDIRVRGYKCEPETKIKYIYEGTDDYFWDAWRWGVIISNVDFIADDWVVSNEELI